MCDASPPSCPRVRGGERRARYETRQPQRFGEVLGLPQPWEVLCKSTDYNEDAYDDDPTVLEYTAIDKANGIQPVPMKQIRGSVGAEREAWRLAMQAEVDSLRDNGSYAEATSAELKKLHHRDILPMKLVTGVKRDVNAAASKFKVRAVVCGNFQRKQQNEDLYTANADITSVRAALAAAAEKRFSIKVLDVKTAFLNAHLPDSFETVFIRPPQALVEFGLVAPGTVWRCIKAIYGLRISPKAWGQERDKELKKMTFNYNGKEHRFVQSVIDPSVWIIQRVGFVANAAGSGSTGVDEAVGYLITYVDDFLILGADPLIDKVTDVIRGQWKITEKPTVSIASGNSVEYLSVNITATPSGYFLDQTVYTKDLLSKWSMDECRAIGSLEDPGDNIEEEDEPDEKEVRTAQRLAGGLNWLATRTRPDIAFIVPQLSSAATKAPRRAIALGKRTLRYLAGTREHGIQMDPRAGDGSDVIRSERSGGTPVLQGFGDASYEEGWAQTGVLIKYRGMLVSWKSTKQPQVPRSTAEAECTAMAYAAQYLEGIEALMIDLKLPLGKPMLYCDNRAAVHLSAGSS